MSSEINKAARMLNPSIFHLQKLGLELKCPLCMNLLNKPVLLPCNHIFCKGCIPEPNHIRAECAACQHCFTNQEIRPASYMKNIVGIYKNLNATFNSTVLPFLSAGGLELTKKTESPDLPPGTSPSFGDAKHKVGSCSNIGSSNGRTENNKVKRSATDNLDTAGLRVDHDTFHDDTFQGRWLKKQKKLSHGLSEAVLGSHGHGQQSTSHPDNASVSNFDEENKFKEDISDSMIELCDILYNDQSCCEFCGLSMVTKGTGTMLYYADGKKIAKDEAIFRPISVHRKCMEWAPQVYYDGDTIKNMESELVRASKLKCSGCGFKGAALGCLAKSCRRSYHLHCALITPNCRWDHENFAMLCPIHKSIKLPCEKSNSRKRDRGEKHSLPTEITSEESNFCAPSTNGPKKWVFCESALSSEEKSLLVKFATTCGVTVVKSWNPEVTHVIAAIDANGASSRTIEVLMAILNGRWVLSMDWVKACTKANCPVDEEPYEVNLDNHGCRDGPRTGRIRASNNAPKLFDRLSFYLSGYFLPNDKDDLRDLIEDGGGTIIMYREQAKYSLHVNSKNIVVYYHEVPNEITANKDTALVQKRFAVQDRLTVANDIAELMDCSGRSTYMDPGISSCMQDVALSSFLIIYCIGSSRRCQTTVLFSFATFKHGLRMNLGNCSSFS